MGMDPLSKDENWEVTIALEGPLKRADYKRFRDELDKFFDAVALIQNTHPDAPVGTTVGGPKLQARLLRSGVRRTA
jgi:hypothetical protein